VNISKKKIDGGCDKVQYSNIVPVKERKLLFFGVDYLTINLIRSDDYGFENKSRVFKIFNTFFGLPHNTSNADEYSDINWCDHDVDLAFKEYKKGQAIEISLEGRHVITIIKIDPESGMGKISPYLYRVEFRGRLFNMARIGKLEIEPFLKDFLWDYENKHIAFNISRLDICADLAGFLPNDIDGGFTSSDDISRSYLVKKKDGTETIYFGKGGRKKIRAYNKLIEANKHGKKADYLDYFQHENVTRLEVELKAESCKKFGIKPADIYDRDKIFSIYSRALNTKKTEFRIMKFIEKELKEVGVKKMNIDMNSIDKHPLLSFCKYNKRFLKQAVKIRDIYELNPIIILLSDKQYLFDKEIEEFRCKKD